MTPCQLVSLTSVSAEPIWAHSAWRSHPAALGIPNPRSHCIALYRIHHPLCNQPRCHLDYASSRSSIAYHQFPRGFPVCDPRHVLLDDS